MTLDEEEKFIKEAVIRVEEERSSLSADAQHALNLVCTTALNSFQERKKQALRGLGYSESSIDKVPSYRLIPRKR